MSQDADRPAPGGPGGWQPVRHVGASRRAGEIVSLGGAILLLVALLALRWYGAAGASGPERAGPSRALGAWQSMPVARWLMVAAIALALGVAGLRGVLRGRHQVAVGVAAAGLTGGATALVLVYRVLISPPQPTRVFDVKLGAALGLAGAVAIAAGSWESWRSGRPRERFGPRQPYQAATGRSRLTSAP